MQYRRFGKTGWQVSEIGFGAWAIGGAWGDVDDATSMKALHEAVDRGINFFDTADVYGNGHSEKLLARLRRERDEPMYIASKCGRRAKPHDADAYTRENIETFLDRTLENLETDCLDLLQLHCPPTEVYYRPEVFGALDELVQAGKLRHYGVSVETVEQALKAIEYPNLASVQIIFNIFRQRPAELFFEQAKKRDVAILARVPLASGLLSGKFTREAAFADNDHRHFNVQGDAFDVGETFAGIDFETGLEAVERLRALCPGEATLAQFALRWILMFDAVSCAIPGAKRPDQVEQNAGASDLPAISDETLAQVRKIYHALIRPQVHHRW